MSDFEVIEHAQPYATQLRYLAQELRDEAMTVRPTSWAQFERELRAAADYIEKLEEQMAKKISSEDFEPTPRKKAITANRGASLSRQYVVARLRRDRRKATAAVRDYIDTFIEWVNGQSIRAAKKSGGLGR